MSDATLEKLGVKVDYLEKQAILATEERKEIIKAQSELLTNYKLTNQRLDQGFDQVNKTMLLIQDNQRMLQIKMDSELSKININHTKIVNALTKMAPLRESIEEINSDIKSNTTDIEDNKNRIHKIDREHIKNYEVMASTIEKINERGIANEKKLDEINKTIEGINGLKYSGKTIVFILSLIATIVTIVAYIQKTN